MPRASRRSVRKEIDLELKENFDSLISSLSAKSDIEQFFRDFLTPEESTMLTKRLMLHLMLENGYRTSEIQAFLNISKETVRVHKNIWSRGGATYRKIISKIAGQEKTRQFFKKLEKLLKPFDLAIRSRNDMKARAKLASGDWN